ncbi:MAG: type II toxin-antitoxin system RelE/ParE family toxin [Saprospiraceae bacterium]|nr:type II toxin-antitoxin system RelE/ParE family toxin [Saprospiraceae bacterium]
MATFRIAEKAKQDLRSIWNYTYETWTAKQADTYLKELMNEFITIARDPQKGRNYEELDAGFFGVKRNKHVIFYRITETGEVEIIRVLLELMDISIRIKE